ncbi:SH3 beta-barrel fold-containing protein [Phocaeicola salanitronis]|uniref:SH3 beta-barrel fold-containing protein n=1 Tax=Phocaeicola salanitronis TaxID=376805 RepID=UPI0025A362DF|nr:SH3 beta-barrel fold-containing protein [Phocaeicola salanitronis]MDM8307502.1 SH3 beta-barrel fold-containing protein [Phocaeicola salanitronis]
MKAIQFNSNNVIATAVKCMQHDMDEATAFSKGMMAETLKKRMMRGEVVRFCYEKLDGTIRYAVGTLQSDAVKANIEGTGIPKRFYGMFVYLDLQKMEWRGFKQERLIGIVD